MTTPIVAAPARFDGAALFAERGAASWHWGTFPAQHLARRGLYVDVLHLDSVFDRARLVTAPRDVPLLVDYSAVGPDPAEMQRHGGRITIIVDDDIWHPTPWLPIRATLAAHAERIEPMLRAAAGLVVPTHRLAAVVERFGVPVDVIPPALPPLEELPCPRVRPDRAALRLGWSGSFTHHGDLEIIASAMLDLLARRDDVTFVVAGKCFPDWIAGQPRIERHPGAVYMPAYFTWLASLDLDVFLCPLASGQPFNDAKPCLKPLEAAALGIPVAASAVGAYAAELRDEETALLTENTTAAWSTALVRMIEDADLRAHLAAAGRTWAAKQTIGSTIHAWEQLWRGETPP